MTIDGRGRNSCPPYADSRRAGGHQRRRNNPQLCQQKINDTDRAIANSLEEKLNLDGDKVVEDFIAVLPHYEWLEDKRGGRDLLVEKKVGFRMQSNLHLAVPDEATAKW